MDKKVVLKTKEYLILAAVILGVYIGFKYLSPLITPFLFAFAFVKILHPFLERVQRSFRIKKGFLTAGILLILFITMGLVLWGIAMVIFHKVGGILGNVDLFEEKFYVFISGCCDGIGKRFGLDGDGIEIYIVERVNIFINNFQVQVVPKMMDQSLGYVKNAASVVGFFGIMIIAAILLAKDYSMVMNKLRDHEELQGVLEIGKKVFCHVAVFIKTQLIILGIISLLCTVTLLCAGIEGGIFLGMFTGFMDMLPFIGTGMVLMPLAFWQILNGYYAKAVVCVILYVACVIIREFLEPKLVGEQVGILPVCILFAVYTGVKVFGIFGIIKGPLALITIYEVYLYLRKSKEKDSKKTAEA
ncbi:AI-2E family transporter [Kineothrix sp. MB12-C1]|uniref:AI-2E family transporter n=1 Tax=Kineothrix sp. MB12-C1 TaxID=3070215 RepID=UPI0027D25E59|nr:AI-2E family transporter [Kineothrix sp. MB12-C1]WMC91191.1 AI-2E family transporter [Kineothrix sp. MB12-C1]